MKIKRLELQGFKSFKDRTVIQFDAGITGIVGPNGCGKSNIVDALLWVMGEQSAKHLRGSSMEDVIFAGAEGYAPSGYSEVSLTLENDGGPFPARWMKHQEVMVTRRLHRSGESEYLINKEQARLKDIHEIFMDTGAGAKGFSIIEQGAIGKIISAKPDDRRVLIEEAAGITKFRVRKRESQRKLQSTEQNLLRLNDIVTELKRQIDGLQRQAKKAERYREIKTILKDLELTISSRRFRELRTEVDECSRRLEELKLDESQSQAELQKAQALLQEMRLQILEKEKDVQRQQSRRFDAQTQIQTKQNEIQRIEIEIEQGRKSEAMTGSLISELEVRAQAMAIDLNQTEERLDSVVRDAGLIRGKFAEEQAHYDEARKQGVLAEEEMILKRKELVNSGLRQSHLEAQKAATEARIEDLESREERTRAVLQELSSKRVDFERIRNRNFEELEKERQLQLAIMGDVDNFESNRAVLVTSVESRRQTLENQKDQMNQVVSRLYGLENLDANFEGFQEGVKNLMFWQKEKGVSYFAPLADKISVPQEFEVAMESALGGKLQVLVAKESATVTEAISYLKEKGLGRSSFYMGTPDLFMVERPQDSAIEAFLADVLNLDAEVESVLRPLVKNIAVVRSLNDVIRLKSSHPGWVFVTREGDIATADGIVTGGTSENADSGVLRRRREMKELSAEKDQWNSKVQLTQVELKKFEEQLQTVIRDLEAARRQKTEKEILIASKEKDLERSEQELQNLLQAHGKQEAEASEIQGQRLGQEASLRQFEEELETLRGLRAGLESDLETLGQQVERSKADAELMQKSVTDLQVRLASKDQEIEGLKRQKELYSQSLSEIESQKNRMAAEATRTVETLSHQELSLQDHKVQLDRLINEAQVVTQELSQLQDQYEVLGAELRRVEDDERRLTQRQHEHFSTANELQLKHEQAKLKEAHLVDQISERYVVNLAEVAPEYQDRPGDMTEMEKELEENREKIRKMGEVNLSAIEEYDDVMKRYEFLSKQQEDLLEAKIQLQKVIDRIDRICSKQFRDTFEAVNTRFERVFPILFGGGEAKLLLVEDPEHPNEDPGIDIFARPPGKKMQSMSLLSGGEKALTSVALIFSIFLVKPSPFCLLDEVDAPLDDANVFRFNELIKEMAKRSQIIVVTHNKYTMEVNDKLYGVTMEERGVSKMVSVDLQTAQRTIEAEA